jgi:hypothetical protein
VANTGDEPVQIEVDRAGQSFDPSGFAYLPSGQGSTLTYAPLPAGGLPPSEVAILFLAEGAPADNFACPAGVNAAVQGDTAVHGTGRGNAFHIRTTAPVVAYQIFPYGGGDTAATSATLLIPTSGWDLDHVVVNAYPKSQVVAQAAPSLDVVALEDGTTVTFDPVVAIAPGGGLAGTNAGQPVSYQLQRGEFLQITQPEELTGSRVVADKPVGLFGGATCLNVPVDAEACDTAQQQIPAIRALGSEYVAVRYRARKKGLDPVDEQVPWRLVGGVDGIQLTYEPSIPAGAPTTLAQGEVAEFWATGPFVVKSQDTEHPFYFSTYMTGGLDFLGEGDPEWVNVVPTGQYLDEYVFFADPTYSETSLTVVRRRGEDGQFADVELDCGGVIEGWQAVGDYEMTRVDLVTGNFEGIGGCNTGRRTMTSAAPFGVTVWGWGSLASGTFFTAYVSYAYPAGMGVKQINDVDIPTPK